MKEKLYIETKKRKITQRELASAIGISERALNMKMTGKKEFAYDEMCSIRDKYFPNWKIDDLFKNSVEESGEGTQSIDDCSRR